MFVFPCLPGLVFHCLALPSRPLPYSVSLCPGLSCCIVPRLPVPCLASSCIIPHSLGLPIPCLAFRSLPCHSPAVPLPCLAVLCIPLPCLTLHCLLLPSLPFLLLASPCRARLCNALPCRTLPCLTLPCLAFSAPAHHCLILPPEAIRNW